MNKKETATILSVLRASYPHFYKDMAKDELQAVVSLWHEMFKNDKAEIVSMAVKALIASDTKGFPPVIGQVKEQIYKLTSMDNDVTEEEAWAIVKKACRYYTYVDEFEKLPDMLKRLVGSAGQLKEWALIDNPETEAVTKSNFIRSYRARKESDKEYAKYPKDVKEVSDKIKRLKGIDVYKQIGRSLDV